jgi:hypothetical protein
VAFVLEWFGYARAGRAAQNLVRRSKIPDIARAVTFLEKHGEADEAHIRVLADALAEVTAPEEADAVLLAARVVAELYIGFFEAGVSGVPPFRGDSALT